MHIKKLQLLNFQVIESFEAEFDGTIYLIKGDNELGKSTLLKAIGALLTGKRDNVLRTGASNGFAKMVIGDEGDEFEVSLSFTEANPRGTLTIKQKSTGLNTNNVTMLSRLFGYQDFDAVEFSRWSETAEGRRKQIAVVKALLPEPVKNRIEQIDKDLEVLKMDRTGANRNVKYCEGLMKEAASKLGRGEMEKYASPIDVTELLEKQKTNVQLAEKAKTARAMLEQRNSQLAEIPARIQAVKERANDLYKVYTDKVEQAKRAYEEAVSEAEKRGNEIGKGLQEALDNIEAERMDLEIRKANAENWLFKYDSAEKVDVSSMLAEAESHNRKYNLVLSYRDSFYKYTAEKEKADSLDAQIKDLASERAALIAGANLPVSGLAFTEDGLELNGIPFVSGQVSDSQIMETAAKLVIASNPKVKVFRIGRGESLGSKRMKAIVDLAKENGFQGFIEQVQRGQDTMTVEEYIEV